MGQSEWISLNDIRNVHAEFVTISEQFLYFVSTFIPKNDANIGYPCVLEIFNRVFDDWFISYRNQLL